MSEAEIRAASDGFYSALNKMANGDASSMADVWANSENVTSMHPIGGREVGWEAVGNSFAKVASLAGGGKIWVTDQRIQVLGDTAYEVAVEHGEMKLGGHDANFEHRVTNIYHRQGDAWKLVHHHTDTSPAMLDILSKL